MKHLLAISIIVFLSGCRPQSNIEYKNGLTIIHLYGDSYDRGKSHGELLKDEISSIIDRWKIEVENEYNMSFNRAIDLFFNSTGFEKSITDCCPELIKEIKGISDGSGIDYRTILAFQLSEEIDVFSDLSKASHCTSMSINRNDELPTFLAQNMDPPKFLHGKPTLLHFVSDTLESYVFTFPGFIGLTGMNSEGVGITCNGMSMLNKSLEGIPVSFMVRKVLGYSNEYDAFRFIQSAKIAIPQCYTIAGKNEARCYECSANMKTIAKAFPERNITLHTNFPLNNTDFNNGFIALLRNYGKTTSEPYYCPRYFLAYDLIKDFNFQLNAENIGAILSSAQNVIEPISNDNTYGSLIMELSSDPNLYIAPGKPSINPYIKFNFNSP